MSKNNLLDTLVKNKKLTEVSEGILSALDESSRGSDYDSKVNAYDAIIGNRFYNRLVWGNWPENYKRFCANALREANAQCVGNEAIVLDAGCGSLVFTATTYAEANNRLTVLLDRSIGMLERGRERLKQLCGTVPDNIVFLQGNIFDLPFHNASFDCVMSQGVIHMFDQKERLLNELERVKAPQGHIHFTSLVANNWLGRTYLSALHRAGEVATVHSSQSLTALLDKLPQDYEMSTIGNMMYAKA